MRVAGPDAPVWIDGEWTVMQRAGVRLADPGVLAGIGVYETLGVRQAECL